MRIYKSILFATVFFVIHNLQTKPFDAHLAGSWYPAQRTDLKKLLQSFENTTKDTFDMRTDSSKIRALIVPHAGYYYSGRIAAAAYRLLKDSVIDRVIILAPSHYKAFNGVALPEFTQYKIPAGIMRLDSQALNKLAVTRLFTVDNGAFYPEHAIEIQLPLINYFLPKAKIVPLVVGDLSAADCVSVATSLKALITPNTLVIISSDLTHHGAAFGYAPFTDAITARVAQLDSQILYAIQHQDLKKFKNIIHDTGATVCGHMPLEVLLKMEELNAFGSCATRLVAYGNSAETSAGVERLVSYAGLIVTQETNNQEYSMQEKNSLLRYARNTIAETFKKTINPELLKPVMTPMLEKPSGVFVTLYSKNGNGKQLRGCIGTVLAREPLYQAVSAMAYQAAFNDSRFAPLQPEELRNISISISILTQPHSVASYHDIILNKHGIILTVGNSSALFLPKVPQEFGFTLQQTLAELSKKAGLSADAWKSPDAKFQVFESIDFSE